MASFMSFKRLFCFKPYAQVRLLFTGKSLGLEEFDKFCEKRRAMLALPPEKFWYRIDNFLSNSMYVYSDDFKNTVALTKSEVELEKLMSLCERYHVQSQKMKLFVFQFGPLVMRLLHRMKKADVAYTAIENEKLDGFFNQLASYQVCLDLLYECGEYRKLLNVYKRFCNCELAKEGIPRSFQILVMAACYKLNTKDSYQFAISFAENSLSSGFVIVRKALAFLIGLALNQGEPEMALELFEIASGTEGYASMRCLRVRALIITNRYYELAELLRQVFEADLPHQNHQDREISKDAVEMIERCVEKIDVQELRDKIQRMLKLLYKGGHIVDLTTDQLLCAPVNTVPIGLQQENAMIPPGAGLTSRSLAPAANEKYLSGSIVYEDNADELQTVDDFTSSERRRRKKVKLRLLQAVGEHVRAEGPFEVEKLQTKETEKLRTA